MGPPQEESVAEIRQKHSIDSFKSSRKKYCFSQEFLG